MERDWAVLHIDEQRMWVGLTIKEPTGEETMSISPEFIENYLRENGIRSGLCHEAIAALAYDVQYGTQVVVARGKQPVKGRDGMYRFLVALEDMKAKPKINDDGSVDYHNSLKLAMVEEGQVFAVYEPPTSGEYGYTVFSEMLQPVKGRPLPPLRGRGFSVSEDGTQYTANFAGRIYKENERIMIQNIYVVKGDLDISQGNIVFNGDVEIRGDVRSGFSVEAQGDVFIGGHVGASRIKAGRNVTIRKGVQGRGKCEITAGGDVACSFLERCIIRAQGNVYADSILNSIIVARKQVLVQSRLGVIVGGEVTGMQGIYAKEAGCDVGLQTDLRIGADIELMRRRNHLQREQKKVLDEIDLLDKNLKVFESLEPQKRNKETESMRMKILRAKVLKQTQSKQLDEEIVQITQETETANRDSEVVVSGIAYPGVHVYMGREGYAVKEACKAVRFRLQGTKMAAEGIEQP